METGQAVKKEVVFRGVGAAPGIVIGHAYAFKKEVPRVEQWTIGAEAVDHEIDRLMRAVSKSEKELNKILVFAQQKLGEAKAKIFEAQVMVLQDQILLRSLGDRIRRELKNAEYIVASEISRYADLMLAAHDDYMHERAHDMEDLRNRIIRNMQQEKLLSKLEGSSIVVSHSLTPADTMILSRNNVLGYATDLGGLTSHAALLARSLKIPAVLGLNDISHFAATGDLLILDGYGGVVIQHPAPERLEEYEKRRERFLQFESKLSSLKDLPAETTDGRSIELSATVEFTEEIEYVVLQGSQGIGLYRTESLLLDRDDFPSEDEQYREFKKIAGSIYPHRVIMRTFDIGGDKIDPEMAEEPNPFLGWRGIRVMLDRPELFLSHLKAILRASTRRNLSIMFPMVSDVGEVRKAKALLQQAKAELRAAKIKFDANIKTGVMIEIPAAALSADQIAPEVDFFSVGSNDLIQYLLAVDRCNNLVAGLYREFSPPVVQTLKRIVDAGHRHKIWVGICGAMASVPLAAPLLVGLGFDELSVNPSMLPEIKKIIRSMSSKGAQALANRLLTCGSAEEIERELTAYLKKECPDIPLDETTQE